MVAYWSCITLLMSSDVPKLLECARCKERRTIDASLFQDRFLIGCVLRNRGERINTCRFASYGGPLFGDRAAKSPLASMHYERSPASEVEARCGPASAPLRW